MDETKRLLFQLRRIMFPEGPSHESFWGNVTENGRSPPDAHSDISKFHDSHICIG